MGRLCLSLFAGLLWVTLASAGTKKIDFDAATVEQLNAAFNAGALTSEKLVELCLARIQAYDHQGPSLNAVLALNPKAIEIARALDVERKKKGPRSPLHGIPVVLKDNFNTFDMPTTGGSVLLEGSIPPADAFIVKKLRNAGAIILAKVNMSEFASAGAYSSLGGQSKNPHDLARSPAGSSGGTGVAIAAGYATLGLGTDTGGSIRGPATANGVVALKPTHGLLSRGGIIPLALTFDTGGPFARNVYDIAVALGVMTGIDQGDSATQKSEGKFAKDYTKDLNPNALKGARIGIARDFMGTDPDVDWVMTTAIDAMRRGGATVVDVRYPKWLLEAKTEFYNAIRQPEFPPQIADYLSTLGPKYPKNIQQMIERAETFNSTRPDGARPNTSRWAMFKKEATSGSLEDYRYRSVHDFGLPMVRATVEGMLAAQKLDAIVYPTSPRKPGLIGAPVEGAGGAAGDGAGRGAGGGGGSATNIANLTGFPDLIVPAGFTGGALPVGISFFGPAFSEQKLLSLGYSFEQSAHARSRPVNTPALRGESISLP
jgi:amidase